MAEADDELEELGLTGGLTRRDIIRRGVGGFLVLYGGALTKTAVAGVPKFRHKELKHNLGVIQWSHFVPAYDTWFDNVYTKKWGAKHDTDVRVDHINLAQLPARAQADVAVRRRLPAERGGTRHEHEQTHARRAPAHAPAVHEGRDHRGLRLDGTGEPGGLPRRTPVVRAQRDLDRPMRRRPAPALRQEH